jgi:hypothetical protein
MDGRGLVIAVRCIGLNLSQLKSLASLTSQKAKEIRNRLRARSFGSRFGA